jgi:hypothetical protein
LKWVLYLPPGLRAEGFATDLPHVATIGFDEINRPLDLERAQYKELIATA